MKQSVVVAALANIASVFGSSLFPTEFNSTCKCKPFTIDLTWGSVDASNLLPRSAILTNGSMPGPALKLRVGDCVDFTVNNNMGFDTGVHFHGIRQLETPWNDGTPGLTQYAIRSGSSYTYTWYADEPGSYFYHSHYKSQMMDGLYGAIIIAPSEDNTTPFSQISSSATDLAAIEKATANIETIFTSDWNQYTSAEFFSIESAANIDWACADSVILNGKGSVYCLSAADLAANARVQVPFILGNSSLTAKGCIPPSNPLIQGAFNRDLSQLPAPAYDQCTPYSGNTYTYQVDPADGWAAMSFISPSAYAIFVATIDNHKMYVYERNGQYMTPQTVDQVEISPGDRVSFLVKLDQTPGDYTIRIANSGINQVISGFGRLSYKGSAGTLGVAIMNIGGVSPPNSTVTLLDVASAAPISAPAVASTADKTFVLNLMKNPTAGESWAWTLDGSKSYQQGNDDQTPFLYSDPNTIPADDLVLRTNYNDWVDLIVTIAGPLAQPHPIHKHGNKFYVIGSGTGNFNYTSVAQAQAAGIAFNLANPPYVDGYTSTPAQGTGAWMVFRYQANTPGAWFMHCHIQTHFTGGMAVAILDAVDKWPIVPATAGKICSASQHANNTSERGNGTISDGKGGNNTIGAGQGGNGTFGGGSENGFNRTITSMTTTTSATTSIVSSTSGGTSTSGSISSNATSITSGTPTSTSSSSSTTTSSKSTSSTMVTQSSTTNVSETSAGTSASLGSSTTTTSDGFSSTATGIGSSRTASSESSILVSTTTSKEFNSSPTGTAGGLGQWGDWTATPSNGKASATPYKGSATAKPQVTDTTYGGSAWAAWSSISAAAASVTKKDGAAHTVLAGSGKDGCDRGKIGGWGSDFGSSKSGSSSPYPSSGSDSSSGYAAGADSSFSRKGPYASTLSFSTSSMVSTTLSTVTSSWGTGTPSTISPSSGKPTDNASGSWTAWTDVSSSSTVTSNVPLDATSHAPSASWSVWPAGSSASLSQPVDARSSASASSWSTWTDSAPVSASATTSVSTSAASSSWAAWDSSAVAAPAAATGIASYNSTGSNGIATYYGAASSIKAGGTIVVSVCAGILSFLM
ncbi:hypothetical protein LTR51_007990 [Lithohypha guttulata]|nr:hypothetical protein LTR51_007990 [Lithohypha guttulata]